MEIFPAKDYLITEEIYKHHNLILFICITLATLCRPATPPTPPIYVSPILLLPPPPPPPAPSAPVDASIDAFIDAKALQTAPICRHLHCTLPSAACPPSLITTTTANHRWHHHQMMSAAEEKHERKLEMFFNFEHQKLIWI